MTMTISGTGGIVPSNEVHARTDLPSQPDPGLFGHRDPHRGAARARQLHRDCGTLDHRLEPQSFAELRAVHLEPLLALSPELVLLGTGATQRFAPPEVRAVFAERGVGLEAMHLGAACRTYNVLVQEERRVAAALFLS